MRWTGWPSTPPDDARTLLYRTDLTIPAADIGPENPLPPLCAPREVHVLEDLDGLPDDLAANISYGALDSLLPCLLQDGYDRLRRPRALPTIVLENEFLRATVLPDLGGRLYSLLHKPSGRELLHRNPVLQPANLALRNAWFAGGVEWNFGSTGHTTLTCAPVHAARVAAPDGTPMLRLWEWERTRNIPFQVDLWLPADSAFLLVGVRIRNPRADEVPAYWWSNVAVPQTSRTRVLAPASEAWHFGYTNRLARVPVVDGDGDRSYPAQHDRAGDFFFDIPVDQRRWIAAVDDAGTGLAQVSTMRLRGRKLFVWGESVGGRRWQEWLSPSSSGAGYLEIQAGLARTQLEHLRLPAHMAWDWMEAYSPVAVDANRVHSGDWNTAWRAVDAKLAASLPVARLDAAHSAWQSAADREPEERLHLGSGWGALELARLDHEGTPITLPGTPFPDDTLGPAQRPWLALLTGSMPAADTSSAPDGTLVSAPWARLLEAAEDSWLTTYHRGVARWVASDHEGAVAAWTRSVVLTDNPWARRNLAVAASAEGRHADTARLFVTALESQPSVRALVLEAIDALLAADEVAEAAEVLAEIPAEWADTGRFRLLRARVLLAHGDPAAAESLLDAGIEMPDLREGDNMLAELWSTIQRQQNRRRPLPDRYNFSMFGN